MPRFYFDTDDTMKLVIDEYGSELPDTMAAGRLARRTLIEMSADLARGSDVVQCRALVRDEAGNTLFTTEVTLAVIEGPGPSV